MTLSVYNSLAREKQVFTPLDPQHIRLYACGPTVYNYAHIGNARMAVVFDVLVRLLRRLYPRVTYVSNITDVDDKIMAASAETGVPIAQITEKFTRIYNKDMGALGVALPDIQPRATDHIGDMIALCEDLIARGHAYAVDGHVLFHVPSYAAYGALSGRSRDEQIAGARVEVASYKKDPADFVLWKPSSDDAPGWDSPWGRGRPGWHIECSAMAERHLGLPFDIHGGGADLKFPHHENEIAQSCCAHGCDDPASYVTYWMHNGFLTVDGEKMSKSLGNFTLVHDVLDQYPGEAIRMTLLSAHYRQPLDWSDRKLEDTKKSLDRLYKRLAGMADVVAEGTDPPAGFLEALCDDLNVPKAMAALNAALRAEDSPRLKGQILAAGELLGIVQKAPSDWASFDVADVCDAEAAKIDALVAQRQAAKAQKDWVRADALRDELCAMNVVVEDTSDGPKWSIVSR